MKAQNWEYPKPGIPNFEKPHINYADGAPEFKNYKGVKYMESFIGQNTPEDNRFETISDFKWCVTCGGEVEFEYHDKVFGVLPKLRQTENSNEQILIFQKYIDNKEQTEKWYDTADEVLEYVIDGVRLRDIITEVKVYDRTI